MVKSTIKIGLENQCDFCGVCGGEDECTCGVVLYKECVTRCSAGEEFDESINKCCATQDFDCLGFCNGTSRFVETPENTQLCCEVKQPMKIGLHHRLQRRLHGMGSS